MYKRILVCGGRKFADLNYGERGLPEWDKAMEEYHFVMATLDNLTMPNQTDDFDTWLPPNGTVLIQGGARGADSAAHDWAVSRWVPQEEYPADWGKYGKRAGYIRNVEMLEKGKPDVVVAFPGGKGTAMMEDLASKRGVTVLRFTFND